MTKYNAGGGELMYRGKYVKDMLYDDLLQNLEEVQLSHPNAMIRGVQAQRWISIFNAYINHKFIKNKPKKEYKIC